MAQANKKTPAKAKERKTPAKKIAVAPLNRIRNVAGATNEKIIAALKGKGVTVPANADRGQLISMARDAELWGEQGNVVPISAKQRYGAAGNCGDEVAEALNSHCRVVGENGNTYLDLGLLEGVAKANGLKMDRWRHLNVGMQRMNVSNVLRGRVKRGEEVTVGSQTFGADGETL